MLLVGLMATLAASGTSWGQTPAGQLAIYPPDVQLTTSGDRQMFVVVFTRPDGVTEDVTAVAKATLADPSLAGSMGTRSTPWPTAPRPCRSSIKAKRSACR